MTFAAARDLLPEFPLLRRELVGLLRTRRAFWLLLATVAFSGLLPLLSWPTSQSQSMAASEMNIVTMLMFFNTQLAAALLIIPAFTAGAISGERERDTYTLLYSTLLSPASIVFSKVLASVGYVLILLLASAPSVCVLYLLGGVEFTTILKCYAVTLAAVVMSGLVCLTASLRSQRTVHAAVRGICAVVFWNGGLLLILVLAVALCVQIFGPGLYFPIGSGGLAMIAITGLTPFYGLSIEVAEPFVRGGLTSGFPGFLRPWTISIVYSTAVSLIQIFILLRGVRTPEIALSPRKERKRLAKAAGKGPRPIRRTLVTRGLLALGRWRLPLIGNPVFLKEIRSEFYARVWFRRILFWAPLVLFGALAYLNDSPAGRIGAVFGASMAITWFIVPAIAAGSIAREIEQGNLDFLRGTLLPLREAIRGKLLAALYSTCGIPGAAILVILASLVLKPKYGHTQGILAAPMVLGTTYLFTAALGTFFASFSRRALGAMTACYGTMVGIFLIAPMMAGFLGISEPPLLLSLHPISALIGVISNNRIEAEHLMPAFLAVYGGVSVLLWLLAENIVEKRFARDR